MTHSREKETRHPMWDCAVRHILALGVSTDVRLLPYARFLRSGRDRELVEAFSDFSVSDLARADDPRVTYLLSEFISKSDCLDLGIDRKGAAIASFWESEERCSATNRRLWAQRRSHTFSTGATVDSVLHTVSRKILSVLGDFSWDNAEPWFNFGSGANVSLPRRLSNRANKIGLIRPTATPATAALAASALQFYKGWGTWASRNGISSHTDVVGNRITTVPKNYKTERVIAVEPSWNSFFQKGLGGLIRNRLRRVGVDLNDQTPNQRAAERGSSDGTYATIDLKQASDSVSIGIVESLLPPSWLDAMRLVRCEYGVLPCGTIHRYSKFSSMGNAFTFELESLLFWALAKYACDEKGVTLRPLVYGDDIAIDIRAASFLIELLDWFGFPTNQKKTHLGDTPFRESCGKHYYEGSDISPFYIRNDLKRDYSRVLLANNVRRFARRGIPWGLDGRFKRPYLDLLEYVPGKIRTCRIPDGYGDGGIVSDFDEACPSRHKGGWDGYVTTHFPEIEVFRDQVVSGSAPLYLKLFELERSRDVPEKYRHPSFLCYSRRKRRLFVRGQWPSFGPWID